MRLLSPVKPVRLIGAVAVLCATAAAPSSAQSQNPALQLLDVPYVPQSEELCGGAAAAMVMRFWGATGVYAESFSDLVDPTAGGIRGADLIRSLQTRGWQAVSLAGDGQLIQRSVQQRRPPIVLIEDRPGRFHYVVIVGWTAERVVLHDPARAPFRVLDHPSFLRAWSRSGYWTLLALPGESTADLNRTNVAERAPGDSVVSGTGACAGIIAEVIRLAHVEAIDAAHRLIAVAVTRCPQDAAPWRERAGLHALRKQWRQAAMDARQALARDARDDHAARILATSLYLQADPSRALDAWNLLGEPTIDIVDIRGLERTRFAVAARALGLRPQTLLTSAALQRASRRLDALPSALGSRVSYTPGEDGVAQVSAFVLERPLVPKTPLSLAAGGLRALTDRELRVSVASPMRGGELWHVAWRWWEERPRVSFGVDAPAPFGGTWGIEAAEERETYGPELGEFSEKRKQVIVRIKDWATEALAWQASATVERWRAGTALGATGLIRYHLGGDRVAVRVHGGAWSGAARTWVAGAALDWRSRRTNDRTVWIAVLGGETVGPTAPLSLWPGAGTGQGRSHLLRAHSLLERGVIRHGVLGRGLLHANGEWRRWKKPVFRVVNVAPAVFIDAARVYRAPAFADARAHVDLGIGLRVAFPGSGVLRADVARGLRDGQVALSFGWTR